MTRDQIIENLLDVGEQLSAEADEMACLILDTDLHSRYSTRYVRKLIAQWVELTSALADVEMVAECDEVHETKNEIDRLLDPYDNPQISGLWYNDRRMS